MIEQSRGVIEFVVHFESVGVVREPGGVLDVKDIVAEFLKARDVVDVLPDDARDGTGAHEAHDDETLSFHDKTNAQRRTRLRRGRAPPWRAPNSQYRMQAIWLRTLGVKRSTLKSITLQTS